MDIRDLREIIGLTQAQVADELGVPRQEVIDCEENGETYLLTQYLSAFPINPQILNNPDVDPFLPSFDQTTPGHRMQTWRESHQIPSDLMAEALGISQEELARFEAGEMNQLSRRRGEEIERKTGINRKWLMYGDGREKGTPRIQPRPAGVQAPDQPSRENRNPAPNKPAGLRLRQARLSAGLSREDLADMLDLSVSRVAQMESGYIRDQKADHIISRLESRRESPDPETPREAGIRLRKVRKELGFSVREAADLLRLKHTTLAHLESGYITSQHADRLISVLKGVPAQAHRSAFDAKRAGIRIREERIKAGLSQKELSTILRVPVTRISLIELGQVSEKEAGDILRRIQGKPLREIKNRRVRQTDQVILGSNIRDARIRAGLSQKNLGDLLELPQTRISLIERGKVDEATAKQILQKLNELISSQDASGSPAEAARPEKARARRPLRPELGKQIQEARAAARLSQKAVADLLHISQGSVSYMEQGRVDEETCRSVLQAIAEAKA